MSCCYNVNVITLPKYGFLVIRMEFLKFRVRLRVRIRIRIRLRVRFKNSVTKSQDMF